MASHRPLITSFFPLAAAIGDTVRITGFDLRRTSAVSVGGTPVTSFSVADGTIHAVIAGGTTTGRIAVTTPAGTTTTDQALTIMASAPTVSLLAPSSGKAGDIVTLTGSHFTGATAVTVGGTRAAFTVESDTILRLTVPAGANTGNIHVTGPAGSGSTAGVFTYAPTPSVDSFAPSAAPEAATITIHGSGLTGATVVTVGDVPVASFVVDDDTQITATLGSGSTGPVAVTNPNGTGTSVDTLAILPTPTISSFTPRSAAAGDVVSVTGTHLTSPHRPTTVSFGGEQGRTLVATDTRVTAVVPAHATVGPITVSTGGIATSKDDFTPLTAPEIDYVTPLFAQIGDTITVKGLGLTGATAVTVGGVACTGVVVGSDTSLTAVIAAATPTGPVVVTTPNGVVTSAQSIAIQAAPTISARTPSSGPTGTAVLLTGTGFDGVTDVSFSSAKPAAFAVLSPTTIRATVPTAAVTGAITVTNAAGTGTSASFTVS